MQIAEKVCFHTLDCPMCQHYVKAGENCRAFVDETTPDPLLAVFVGKTNAPCERFQKIQAPLPMTQAFVSAPGTKICPNCASFIPIGEKVCLHCGTWFQITIIGYCPTCNTTMHASDSRWCCKCSHELKERRIESRTIDQPAGLAVFRNPLQKEQFPVLESRI